MSGTDIEVTSRAWAALQQRDLEGFLDLIDPEIEFISLVAEAEGATYRGHAGVRDWFGALIPFRRNDDAEATDDPTATPEPLAAPLSTEG